MTKWVPPRKGDMVEAWYGEWTAPLDVAHITVCTCAKFSKRFVVLQADKEAYEGPGGSAYTLRVMCPKCRVISGAWWHRRFTVVGCAHAERECGDEA